MINRRIPACILNTEPYVTFSKRMPAAGLGLGLSGLIPERFSDGPSFHILTLAWSHEDVGLCEQLRQELAAMSFRLSQARYLVLSNTPNEAKMLHRHGIATVNANVLCLADSDRFRPMYAPADRNRVNAAYVAGFYEFKRHYLAKQISQLLLLYWEPNALEALTMRQTLPDAIFTNHDAGDGIYRLLDGDAYCTQLARASVGLCLSAEEGPMRASIEYMLCGLPVVTTSAKGGRLEMLAGPYLTVVPADAGAVSDAVAALCSSPPKATDVRQSIITSMTQEREKMLVGINAWLADACNVRLGQEAMTQMVKQGIWRARPVSEIL